MSEINEEILATFVAEAQEGLADIETDLLEIEATADNVDEVVEICRQKGATVEAKIIDVTDRPAMKQWIETIDETHTLDLVIANAGVSTQTSGETDPEMLNQRLKEINIDGVLNTLDPIQFRMTERRSGQMH